MSQQLLDAFIRMTSKSSSNADSIVRNLKLGQQLSNTVAQVALFLGKDVDFKKIKDADQYLDSILSGKYIKSDLLDRELRDYKLDSKSTVGFFVLYHSDLAVKERLADIGKAMFDVVNTTVSSDQLQDLHRKEATVMEKINQARGDANA